MSRSRFLVDGWRGLFRRQRASGLSVAAFCERERISASSFFSWRRKLEGAAGFAEVKLAGALPNEGSAYGDRRVSVGVKDSGGEDDTGGTADAVGAIELRLPRGRSVLVRPGFCRRTLRELLELLEANCAEAIGSRDDCERDAAARATACATTREPARGAPRGPAWESAR